MTRIPIERPDYRNNGKYQFVRGYAGSGAEMCDHVSLMDIVYQMTERCGPGKLIDDGVDLWWESETMPEGYWREIESAMI